MHDGGIIAIMCSMVTVSCDLRVSCVQRLAHSHASAISRHALLYCAPVLRVRNTDDGLSARLGRAQRFSLPSHREESAEPPTAFLQR